MLVIQDVLLPPPVVLDVLSRYRAFQSSLDLVDYETSLQSPDPSPLSFVVPIFLLILFLISVVFGLYTFLLITTHDIGAGDEGGEKLPTQPTDSLFFGSQSCLLRHPCCTSHSSEFTKKYVKFVNDILAKVISAVATSAPNSEGQCITSY